MVNSSMFGFRSIVLGQYHRPMTYDKTGSPGQQQQTNL